MKTGPLFILWLALFLPWNDIGTINRLKKEAESSFLKHEYLEAAQIYRHLIDSLEVREAPVLLNYAHALYHLSPAAKMAAASGLKGVPGQQRANTNAGPDSLLQRSMQAYRTALEAGNQQQQSVAFNQMGILSFVSAASPGEWPQALALFKEALRKDHTHASARHNYEVLKRLMDQQQNQQKQDQQQQDQEQQQQEQQNQNQENQNQQGQNQENQQQDQQGQQQENQEQQQEQQQQNQGEQGESEDQNQQDQQQQEGREQEDEQEETQPRQADQPENQPSEQELRDQETLKRLREMNISEEKAKMILEAMKNNEIQYIQQQRRKPTQPKKDNKPNY